MLSTLIPLGIIALSTGCAPQASVEPALVQETVEKDLTAVYQHGDVSAPLRLEDVLARAILYNLDGRVAEMDEMIAAGDLSLERLGALPTVNAKLQRTGRSNPGGSSSFSLLTNTESLQPSISSDQYRNTQLLAVQWDLLEAGIGLIRANSASDRVLVAEERRRKVYHGIVQDAYIAYWRTAVAQSYLPVIDELVGQTEKHLENIDSQIAQGIVALGDAQTAKAKLLDQRKQLKALRQGLTLAEVELKTLIDYPPGQPLTVDLQGQDWLEAATLPVISGEMERLERAAFMNRPEIREEVLNKQIAVRDVRMTVLETIPGLDLIANYNKDSNSFLSNKTWIDWTIGITQTINKIITAPFRYKRAENVAELADRRRQALVAAVITQVFVSRARFDVLSDIYDDSVRIDRNAKDILKRANDLKGAGMISGATLMNDRIGAVIASVNRAFAYVDAQDAYGRFVTTMGVDLWEADSADLNVPEFADQIRKNLERADLFAGAGSSGGEG